MSDAKFNSLDEKAHSTILLSLSDEVLYEVADEETSFAPLEEQCPKPRIKARVPTGIRFVTYEEFDGEALSFMGNDSPCKAFCWNRNNRLGCMMELLEPHRCSTMFPDITKNLSIATCGSDSKGETITGSASVSCSEKSNSDLTKLWHMRLWTIRIKRLRTEMVVEFCSTRIRSFCRDEEFVRPLHCSPRYTPQQNGVAERMNRTLLERTRCLLLNAGLDRSFWAYSLNNTFYLVNRLPATAIALARLPIEVKQRIWSPSERRVILSRDVTFDEDHLFRLKPDSVESKFEEGASEKVEHVAKQVEYVADIAHAMSVVSRIRCLLAADLRARETRLTSRSLGVPHLSSVVVAAGVLVVVVVVVVLVVVVVRVADAAVVVGVVVAVPVEPDVAKSVVAFASADVVVVAAVVVVVVDEVIVAVAVVVAAPLL
ncbi:retrovirus-related pol polyprotein from transposon TNT 1-94 [Tanacetum coccineum]